MYRMWGNFWGMKISWKDERSDFHDLISQKPEKCFQNIIIKLTELANSQLYFCETDIYCKIHEIFVPR